MGALRDDTAKRAVMFGIGGEEAADETKQQRGED
jgi:hypothetical protein